MSKLNILKANFILNIQRMSINLQNARTKSENINFNYQSQ